MIHFRHHDYDGLKNPRWSCSALNSPRQLGSSFCSSQSLVLDCNERNLASTVSFYRLPRREQMRAAKERLKTATYLPLLS